MTLYRCQHCGNDLDGPYVICGCPASIPPEPPTIEGLQAALTAREVELATVKSELAARAKVMLRLRDQFVNARDDLEDEGDRVYFGSTNDADAFRDIVTELEDWHWHDVMRDAQSEDLYAKCRDANEALTAARAQAAEEMRERAAKVVDECNREGPYQAIGAACRIRALPLETPK